MLDRDHPLWQLIMVHGRADGNTAVIWKVHYAMIDGVSGVDLTMVLHDLKPDAAPPLPPASPWQPRPLPDPLTLLQHAVRDRLTKVAHAATDDVFAGAVGTSAPNLLRPTPRAPRNAPLSSERCFGWAEFPFGKLRRAKTALGGTVNDAVQAADAAEAAGAGAPAPVALTR
ncbi:MAG TPA: wax ester/triacylglycerol synthase domain-containing protein [Verrucomicrobiae bacterium]|jgi:diacylglycerol O-acyltransferase / wax synthase|nr:wax ester/triacylglycerol synthase domain-containing protein [Verrucomicrobiae bacterium]